VGASYYSGWWCQRKSWEKVESSAVAYAREDIHVAYKQGEEAVMTLSILLWSAGIVRRIWQGWHRAILEQPV
jgi:hypothetical protein